VAASTGRRAAGIRPVVEQVGDRVDRSGRGSDAEGRIANVRQAQIGEQAGKLAARNVLKQRAGGWSEGCGRRHQIADDGEQP
jgi:hypothetical protein